MLLRWLEPAVVQPRAAAALRGSPGTAEGRSAGCRLPGTTADCLGVLGAKTDALPPPQVMTLHQNGVLDIYDRVSGRVFWSVGPFTGCTSPYKLSMLANGQLVRTSALAQRPGR